MSDIDTVLVDSLKALDSKRPIREADIPIISCRRAPAIRRTDIYGMSGRNRGDHSALMPANLTTLPHFSVSSAMSLPKSAGEPRSTCRPGRQAAPLSWDRQAQR